MMLDVDEIGSRPDVYPRRSVNLQKVADYADAMQAGCEFPPIVVGENDESGYFIIDGAHRLAAQRLLAANEEKWKQIKSKVHAGISPERAYEEAVHLNSEHGLQFTKEERESIIRTLDAMGRGVEYISGVLHVSTGKLKAVLHGEARYASTGNRASAIGDPDIVEMVKLLKKLTRIQDLSRNNAALMSSLKTLQQLIEVILGGKQEPDDEDDEEGPEGNPLITVTPHTRANRVMDLETLSRAILNLHEGMEEKQARDTALHVLEFFGYNDYAYANALAPDDNSVFYHLEDLGLLTSTSETIQLLNNGREWRVFQWLLRKDRIVEAATAERKPESGVYETIPQEAWNR